MKPKSKRHHARYSVVLDIWLMIFLLGCWYMGVFSDRYFSLGPNSDFKFLGAVIDTWSKWSALIAFQAIGSCVEFISGDMIWPWITTSVQDEDKRELDYSRPKTWYIVQNQFLYSDIKSVFSIFLSLSQIDLALVSIVCSQLIIVFWTLPTWLNGKTHRNHDIESQSLINE